MINRAIGCFAVAVLAALPPASASELAIDGGELRVDGGAVQADRITVAAGATLGGEGAIEVLRERGHVYTDDEGGGRGGAPTPT